MYIGDQREKEKKIEFNFRSYSPQNNTNHVFVKGALKKKKNCFQRVTPNKVNTRADLSKSILNGGEGERGAAVVENS